MKINNTGKEVFLCFSQVSWDVVGQRVRSQTVFTPCLNWDSHFFAFRGDFHHCLVSALPRCRLQADSSAQLSLVYAAWTKYWQVLKELTAWLRLQRGHFSAWPRVNYFIGHPKLLPEPLIYSPETPTDILKTILLRSNNYFFRSLSAKNSQWEYSQQKRMV